MAIIMNAVAGTQGSNELLKLDKLAKLKMLRMHPNAPRVSNPDENQLNALITYWSSVLNHLDKILMIQRYDPDYMPVCEMIEIDGGNVRIVKIES